MDLFGKVFTCFCRTVRGRHSERIIGQTSLYIALQTTVKDKQTIKGPYTPTMSFSWGITSRSCLDWSDTSSSTKASVENGAVHKLI